MSIKVISLRRSNQRKERFQENNQEITFEFYDGVDGSLLLENEINNPKHFSQPLNSMSLGAYGCALSHLSLWEQVIECNIPLTISEDDAIFRNDFEYQSEKVIKMLPNDWDIILWGWNFNSILSLNEFSQVSPTVMLFSQKKMRNNISIFKSGLNATFPFRLDKCFGTPAYTISPNGAKKFKELCFPMVNFELFFPVLNKKISNSGIDIAMNKIYATTQSFVCFPPLVLTENLRELSTVLQSN
jgi:GR25 family glycosyltransferase involved in LPS biosynthesis